MNAPTFVHRNEADRLLSLPKARARAEFSDRIGRSFQLDGDSFAAELEFNALLATALRERESPNRPGIWSP